MHAPSNPRQPTSGTPARAVVLAAGEGSRLRPLTGRRPKPMLPVANRPILRHVVDALAESGVRRVTIVVGHQRERVQAYFGDGSRFGVHVDYAVQDRLLGTAHALSVAAVDDAEHVLVIGGDNLVDATLVQDLLDAPAGPAVAAKPSATPSKYGVLTVRGDLVERIDEKPGSPTGRLVSTGCYRLPGKLLARLPDLVRNGHPGLPEALQALLDEGETLRMVETTGLWMDAIYPWDLLTLNARLAPYATPGVPRGVHASAVLEPGCAVAAEARVGPNAVVSGRTSIGAHAVIGAGAILEDCIVMDGAQIGPGSVLRDAIVGEGARLGARVTGLSGPCEARTSDGVHALESFGAVVGADAEVGGCSVLDPGVLVGEGARIGPACHVSRNVPDRGHVQRGA